MAGGIMRLICIALSALLAIVPAQAQQLTPQQDWNVMDNREACSAIQTYGEPGQADLIIHERPDKPFLLTISDARWDVQLEDEPHIRFMLDGRRINGRILAMTRPGSDIPGYAIMINEPFHDRFAKASGVRVYLRDALIADMSLAGVGEAMKRITQCLESKRP
jgi:hypothetical protein